MTVLGERPPADRRSLPQARRARAGIKIPRGELDYRGRQHRHPPASPFSPMRPVAAGRSRRRSPRQYAPSDGRARLPQADYLLFKDRSRDERSSLQRSFSKKARTFQISFLTGVHEDSDGEADRLGKLVPPLGKAMQIPARGGVRVQRITACAGCAGFCAALLGKWLFSAGFTWVFDSPQETMGQCVLLRFGQTRRLFKCLFEQSGHGALQRR
jgi:hypothetical protein